MTDPLNAPRPRFLADRCLGRLTVRQLRESGWDILHLSDVFSDDAQSVGDGEWLAYAGRHGLAGLTKDKKIRYQASFEQAIFPVFALADGSLPIAVMAERLDAARERIWVNATNRRREFWIVYSGGRVERRFP